MVLLYHIVRLDQYCHGQVNETLTLETFKTSILLSMGVSALETSSSEHPKISMDGISELLEVIKSHLSHEHHEHGEDDDDHHSDEDDDDDEHHDEDDHDDHDHDHDHNERHRREASDEDHHHHDDDDSHDDDDHDDKEHSATNVVVEKKCLSSDGIFFYLGEDNTNYIESDRVQDIASIILYLLSEGSHIEKSCRLLPRKKAFVENIFEQFSNSKQEIDVHEFESLMTKMKIKPGAAESEEDHSGHNHKRRRRSANIISGHTRDFVASRHRRQTPLNPALSKCYSASQLMALYDASSSIDQATFQQMCPSLVSQSLYADCTKQITDEGSKPSKAEMYGYGTLATTIICLCAIFGVVFIPCASTSVYNTVMSLFMGLSVGTLFADAVLHLVPLAMGLHNHEHGHSSEIEVEEHVKVGLAIILGLYLFYILELVMSRCEGAHTHDPDHDHDHHHDNHQAVFSNAAFEGSEKSHELETGVNGAANGAANGYAPGAPETGKCCLSPVAVMILFGDALHNFADGLALGAAFAQSSSTGIATSVAVFCHELPHELGDFAVLLKSGLSYKLALFLNLLSALTAYIGLYLGLTLISEHDGIQKWIFALAAGMFIYIALVDVLPILIKSKNGCSIFLNNIGILLGFLIMFVIALVEEHIEV